MCWLPTANKSDRIAYSDHEPLIFQPLFFGPLFWERLLRAQAPQPFHASVVRFHRAAALVRGTSIQEDWELSRAASPLSRLSSHTSDVPPSRAAATPGTEIVTVGGGGQVLRDNQVTYYALYCGILTGSLVTLFSRFRNC